MRITSKGQVTIPAEIRRKAGLLPNTEVEFVVEGNTVRIMRRKQRKAMTKGERLIALLEGSATEGFTTDEIMRMTRGE